jgi:hypothetical protein
MISETLPQRIQHRFKNYHRTNLAKVKIAHLKGTSAFEKDGVLKKREPENEALLGKKNYDQKPNKRIILSISKMRQNSWFRKGNLLIGNSHLAFDSLTLVIILRYKVESNNPYF